MNIKTFIVMLLVVVSMVIMKSTVTFAAADQNLSLQPRYLQTDKFGYYECHTNVIWQNTDKGRKLVLNLGGKTSAYNSNTGQTISDWSSFYITDMTAGYFKMYDTYERILISGLLMIPDTKDNTKGHLADVFLLYYPESGKLDTLHINIRYPMKISKEQHSMTKPFDYLESNILFPRGIITNNGTNDVFVLSGAADLSLFKSKNEDTLNAKGYDGDFFELVRITGDNRIYSEFYGPLGIFGKEENSSFRIPELSGLNHFIDRRLIVFRTDDYQAFAIASVGTDDSDFCTALGINIKTQPEDTFYWIERDKFMELAGMKGMKNNNVPFGSTWTEKDMDSYIDR